MMPEEQAAWIARNKGVAMCSVCEHRSTDERFVEDVVFVNDGGTTDANWNLIKDAPLLLAEVKKLREQLKEANDVIQYALEMSSDDDSTRVFEDYLEVIE